MKLLHIVATPRAHGSNTLQVSKVFLDSLQAKHADLEIDVIHLFGQTLPDVSGNNIESKYALMIGQPIDKQHKESWEQIETLIQRFLAADFYVISTPMWNFGLPYPLKYFIDAIVQPGYLYKYTEQGQPVPLTLGKRMVCVTSRGGDYSPQSPLHLYDFQEPYLRAIFGFVGITDMHFIHAQPMDITRDMRENALTQAFTKARELAASLNWNALSSGPAVSIPPALKPQTI